MLMMLVMTAMVMTADTDQKSADRFSAALTETGEAASELVFAERENCAKMIDDAADAVGREVAYSEQGRTDRDRRETVLRDVAKLIRGRPR